MSFEDAVNGEKTKVLKQTLLALVVWLGKTSEYFLLFTSLKHCHDYQVRLPCERIVKSKEMDEIGRDT